MKDVLLLVGAGQIGLAITRRVGINKKIIVGDIKIKNAQNICDILNNAGYDAIPFICDLSDKNSIISIINECQKYGEISTLINAAGVSPSQSDIKTILKVDLYGTAVLLEEVGKVIKEGGVGITISSQSGKRMKQLSKEEDELLATTPVDKLLEIPFLKEENIENTLHAYQLAKRANEKRVMYEACRWGIRRARINSISPGIIVTPLAIDEFNGIRGEFYKNMFKNCPAQRPGIADEVGDLAEFIMSSRGNFITGSDFLIDGGATASYYYGKLKPKE